MKLKIATENISNVQVWLCDQNRRHIMPIERVTLPQPRQSRIFLSPLFVPSVQFTYLRCCCHTLPAGITIRPGARRIVVRVIVRRMFSHRWEIRLGVSLDGFTKLLSQPKCRRHRQFLGTGRDSALHIRCFRRLKWWRETQISSI